MTEKTRKQRKLSREILGLLIVSFVISLFLFQLLSLCAFAVVDGFLTNQNIVLTPGQLYDLDGWVFNLTLLVTVGFFVILFLFILGERLSYIREIVKGIDALRVGQEDYEVPLEGGNELTLLAESVNYLSLTQRQVKEKERALSAEKEQLIRGLSHDIRTPLTCILAYSEFLLADNCTIQEQQEYLTLIRKKAEQIKELTDILLDGGRRNLERFENARLLWEQLAGEFEETLEDDYLISVDLKQCPAFVGTFDVEELRRIFDNLSTNIQKYADPEKPVKLTIRKEEDRLVIQQENSIHPKGEPVESYQMGLKSIRRIVHNYDGQVEVRQDEDTFAITMMLSEF